MHKCINDTVRTVSAQSSEADLRGPTSCPAASKALCHAATASRSEAVDDRESSLGYPRPTLTLTPPAHTSSSIISVILTYMSLFPPQIRRPPVSISSAPKPSGESD
eukprot:GHVU01129573.1.p1 GENE.GHVU01129573.1~~GHVU01129573.1.p1  ORF type:complete len:106 (+),score=8.09 GHVU01129573.1:148-465(+)